MNWKQMNVPLDQHPDASAIKYLSSITNIHPLLSYHLYIHGVQSDQQFIDFLYPSLLHLHDPFLMNEMQPAVDRILKAIQNKEKILIFGDYDCDGITSSSILKLALKKIGADVITRLPLRSEGYGLTVQTVQSLPNNIALLITVDNGTSSHAAIQHAKQKGIDVIVTDHHEMLGERPNCVAFLNPKRSDNTYPFPYLCGAGVALKVIQALFMTFQRDWLNELWDYVEYATLGTIADVMPLTGENRTICWAGLRKMFCRPNAMFKLLREELRIKHFDSTCIGFTIGPIFNACGRISDPNIAASILQKTVPTTEEIQQLIALNTKRKQITTEQFIQANRIIKQQALHHDTVIVVQGEFHKGIIGILASKISNHYCKPTIVITNDGTGSARSGNGSSFSIIQAIQACGELLNKYGGHAAAAGLSLCPDAIHVQKFRQCMQYAAAQQEFSKPTAQFLSELPIYNFPRVFFDDLISFEPFGIGNPKPTFLTKNVYACSHRFFGKNNEHVQFNFSNNKAYKYSEGTLFHNWRRTNRMDILYTPNCYTERDFIIRDYKINT